MDSNKTLKIRLFNLQDGLIVNVVEDGPVDLTRLQGNPVQHRHPKLCLYWLLYLHSCTAGRQTGEQGDRLSIRQINVEKD